MLYQEYQFVGFHNPKWLHLGYTCTCISISGTRCAHNLLSVVTIPQQWYQFAGLYSPMWLCRGISQSVAPHVHIHTIPKCGNTCIMNEYYQLKGLYILHTHTNNTSFIMWIGWHLHGLYCISNVVHFCHWCIRTWLWKLLKDARKWGTMRKNLLIFHCFIEFFEMKNNEMF